MLARLSFLVQDVEPISGISAAHGGTRIQVSLFVPNYGDPIFLGLAAP